MLLFSALSGFSGSATRFSVHLKCDGLALRSRFAELTDPLSPSYAKWLTASEVDAVCGVDAASLRELDDDDFSVVSVGGAARAMGCRESDFRVDDDDMSMVSSASRSGRKVKRKSERRALVDKGAPKTYGKRAAPASRSKGEGFYEL